jgi:hypothetical protein
VFASLAGDIASIPKKTSFPKKNTNADDKLPKGQQNRKKPKVSK